MSRLNEPLKIMWLANRFRCMSAAEVGYRIRHALRSPRLKRRMLGAPPAVRPPTPRADHAMFARPAGIDPAPYMREADAILEGEVTLFADMQVQVGRIPQWNRGPNAAGVASATGDDGVDADIRPLWELNRHLQWVRLAQAHVLSGDPRYAAGLAAQLNSWLDQCPPLSAPNWTSALEAALRLINWSAVWQLLGGWDGALFKDAAGAQLRSRWLASIFAHCLFVSENFSRYSSANNHLIGELTGLYVAARTWNFGERSSAWARQCKTELEHEAAVQHFADGVNREQAFAYQVFTCECLTIAGVYGRHGGDAFSSEFENILRRAFRFLRSLRDVGGNLAMVGDSDDGAVLRLEPRNGVTQAATLLALGDAVFGAVPLDKAGDTARWLLGGSGPWPPGQAMASPAGWSFPEGGYFLFGSAFGTADEIKGMVDCGPIGYLGIAAHGHADALSVVLSIAGEECLIDPGTYTYGGDYRWRAYFRGTCAHNTLRVDGADQSVSGGRFMWTHKAAVRVERAPVAPGQFDFVGSHDGYLRLSDPLRHVRGVTYDDSQTCLRVKDEISGNAAHEIEQFWHFAPHIEVEIGENGVITRGRRFEMRMQFSQRDWVVERFRGAQDPPLGWISRGYGTKQPTTVLRVRTRAKAVCIETRFSISIFKQDFQSPSGVPALRGVAQG